MVMAAPRGSARHPVTARTGMARCPVVRRRATARLRPLAMARATACRRPEPKVMAGQTAPGRPMAMAAATASRRQAAGATAAATAPGQPELRAPCRFRPPRRAGSARTVRPCGRLRSSRGPSPRDGRELRRQFGPASGGYRSGAGPRPPAGYGPGGGYGPPPGSYGPHERRRPEPPLAPTGTKWTAGSPGTSLATAPTGRGTGRCAATKGAGTNWAATSGLLPVRSGRDRVRCRPPGEDRLARQARAARRRPGGENPVLRSIDGYGQRPGEFAGPGDASWSSGQPPGYGNRGVAAAGLRSRAMADLMPILAGIRTRPPVILPGGQGWQEPRHPGERG